MCAKTQAWVLGHDTSLFLFIFGTFAFEQLGVGIPNTLDLPFR
jgi:hypothetical protein